MRKKTNTGFWLKISFIVTLSALGIAFYRLLEMNVQSFWRIIIVLASLVAIIIVIAQMSSEKVNLAGGV